VAPAESRRVEIEGKHRGSGRAQFAWLVLPVFAAFGQQQLAYALVRWACTRELPILVHLPSLLAVAVIGIVALVAWRNREAAGRGAPADARSSDARARFMSMSALTLCAFSLLLVLAQWLPTLFIHPCQR
jgi:uncharacterized iron-regulated membrane protein